MPVYFTSDHHFGHAAARSFYCRPFSSLAEMDAQMIDRWNSVIQPWDEVWHLGDFAVRPSPERVTSLISVLHGQKHIIVGNNDDAAVAGCAGWESVQSDAEVTVDRIRLLTIVLSWRLRASQFRSTKSPLNGGGSKARWRKVSSPRRRKCRRKWSQRPQRGLLRWLAEYWPICPYGGICALSPESYELMQHDHTRSRA